MAEDEQAVTFEVLTLSSDGLWRTATLEDNRPDAEAFARRLYERPDVDGVRVVRNTFDPQSGRFHEVQLSSRTKATGLRPPIHADLPPAHKCEDWQDLYHPKARRLVAACLADAFTTWGVTAYEVMGSHELAAKVMQGSLYQQAVQRFAIAHARGLGETPQACMVRVYGLADKAYAALRTACASPAAGPSGMGEAALRAWVWLSRLTAGLGWADKMQRLCAAALADGTADAARLLDTCGAEVMAAPGSIPAILGARGSRRDMVVAALDLAAGSGTPPEGLAGLLAAGQLPHCREALVEFAYREVAGPGMLQKDGYLGEAQAVHEIGRRLDEDPSPQARRVAAALEQRAEALTRPEQLGAALGALGSPEARVDMLAELCQKARPGLHAKMLAAVLGPSVDAAVRWMTRPGQRADIAMSRLAAWQRATAGTPVDKAAGVAGRMDMACAALVRSTGLVSRARKLVPDPLLRCLRLHAVLASGAVTTGQASEDVAAAIEDALREVLAANPRLNPPPGTANQMVGVLRFVEARRQARLAANAAEAATGALATVAPAPAA